jgi:hypothetical protein
MANSLSCFVAFPSDQELRGFGNKQAVSSNIDTLSIQVHHSSVVWFGFSKAITGRACLSSRFMQTLHKIAHEQ